MHRWMESFLKNELVNTFSIQGYMYTQQSYGSIFEKNIEQVNTFKTSYKDVRCELSVEMFHTRPSCEL